MRTTLELKPEHRARLLEIAARRGQKGFSSVVAEAIEAYLISDAAAAKLRKRALRTGGSLSAQEADTMRATAAAIRATWR